MDQILLNQPGKVEPEQPEEIPAYSNGYLEMMARAKKKKDDAEAEVE